MREGHVDGPFSLSNEIDLKLRDTTTFTCSFSLSAKNPQDGVRDLEVTTASFMALRMGIDQNAKTEGRPHLGGNLPIRYDITNLKHIGQGCVYFCAGDSMGHLTCYVMREAFFGGRGAAYPCGRRSEGCRGRFSHAILLGTDAHCSNRVPEEVGRFFPDRRRYYGWFLCGSDNRNWIRDLARLCIWSYRWTLWQAI